MKSAEIGQESEDLLKKGRRGDIQALGRLLTLVENNLLSLAPLLSSLKQKKSSVRIGITGPPGAGKSSLIDLMIRHFRSRDLRVAVIAVDPSSPFSGGALLGDRIRMSRHVTDRGVFIRSIGSRGGVGGLSAATGAMASLMEDCGYDVVLLETVGVGQTELQVMNLADVTAVVLVPESGDVVQTLKAGILEIADVFVVNKADRPGADVLARELESLVEQEGEKKRPVLVTSVLNESGVTQAAEKLLALALDLKEKRRQDPDRLRGELRALLLWSLDQKINEKISKQKIANIYTAYSEFKLPRL